MKAEFHVEGLPSHITRSNYGIPNTQGASLPIRLKEEREMIPSGPRRVPREEGTQLMAVQDGSKDGSKF